MSTRADYARQARERAFFLYEGKDTPHRSCGIALAETFGLPTPSYQALRRGGLTGHGTCGAVLSGTLVLGELLGDPDPTGPPSPLLKEAIPRYRAAIALKVEHSPDTACNDRLSRFSDFGGPERKNYCTTLASIVAETVAEVLWDLGQPRDIPPL